MELKMYFRIDGIEEEMGGGQGQSGKTEGCEEIQALLIGSYALRILLFNHYFIPSLSFIASS
jgi:hypothetical protein